MTLSLLPDLLDRPLRQFPNLWSSVPSGVLQNFFDEDFFPQDILNKTARIYEENNQLHVEVPLPGLKPSEIEVSFNKGVLIVKGESKEEEEDKKRKYYRSSKRSYSYTVALPTQIDEKQEPQAVYADGILNVSLQIVGKSETKKISVKAGASKK